MLSRRIIPCLDVTAGRVVKGVKFQELRDAGDPVACAKAYDAQGADELTFLDITASSDNRAIMHDVVAATADQCFMPLTVGGGLRSVEDIRAMLNAGADKVSLNTAAIQHPDLVLQAAQRFGNQCIVVAIDAKRDPGPEPRWRVYTHGGRNPTELDAVELGANRSSRSARAKSCSPRWTATARRPATTSSSPAGWPMPSEVPVIASGGAGRLEHFAEVLDQAHASAVLAASLFHFGTFTIPQVKDFLATRGMPVRR